MSVEKKQNKVLYKLGELSDVLSQWTMYGGIADIALDAFTTGLNGNGSAANTGVTLPPNGVFFGAWGELVKDSKPVKAKTEGAILITAAVALRLTSYGLMALA